MSLGMICGHCGGSTFRPGREETTCLDCGWADYATLPPPPERFIQQSVFSSAVRYRARYSGADRRYRAVIIDVALKNIRVKGTIPAGRLPFGENFRFITKLMCSCPFCDEDCLPLVNQPRQWVDGKKIERPQGNRLYRCPQGHRFTLVNREDSTLTWF